MIELLRFLTAQGQLFVVRCAHTDRLVRLRLETPAMSLNDALQTAARLTTLSIEKAVFDPKVKRKISLAKVHVHGTTVHVPGKLPLELMAVRLEAKDLQEGWGLLSNLRLPPDDVTARAALAQRLV